MDAAVWGLIGVLLGGAITGWFTVRAESVRADKEARLDREKREDNRQIDRDSFQRANLLELQEALAVWMRAEAVALMFDARTLREHGAITLLPEPMSDDIFESGRQLGYRVQRVKDDGLREALGAVSGHAASIQAARAVYHEQVTAEGLDAEMDNLGRHYAHVQEQLGKTLRAYL